MKPTNDALHQGYKFYLKVTVSRVHLNNGDSTAFFGLYDLRVGCYWDSLSFTDSSSFITNVDVYVGDSLDSIYTMHNPTPSRLWCVLETNEFATYDAQPWTMSAKFGNDVATF